MGNVVTSGGKPLPALPAHMAAALKVLGGNALVKSGLRGEFNAPPEISTRGKIFRLKIDGEEKPLMKVDEDGNEEPVSFLKVIVVGANAGKYKTFYAKKFDENAEGEAPLCYSFDGERPSPYAQEPQCKSCAACPHNEWGSAITESGGKSRACSDNKILAVIPESAVRNKAEADTLPGTAFRVKVSPTALNRSKQDRKDNPQANFSLSEYVNLLDNFPAGNDTAEVPISAVVTRLFFDKQASYPKLQFKFAGFLEEADLAYVLARAEGDDVKAIISDQAPATTGGMRPDDVDEDGVVTPPPAAAKPKTKPADDDDDNDGVDYHAPAPVKTKPESEPAVRRGRKPKATEPDETTPPPVEPAKPKAAAAKPAAKPAGDDDDDDTPRTSSKIDDELKAVADMFA